MRTLRYSFVFTLLFLIAFATKAEAGFNVMGFEIGGPSTCEIPALNETLKCPIAKNDALADLSDSALLTEAGSTSDMCRMVNLIHEYEIRFPMNPPHPSKPTFPSVNLIAAQISRIDRLIDAGYFEDALYWLVNYRIEHAYAQENTIAIDTRLNQTLDALMSKAWAAYREDDFCEAANAVGTFDISENTHFSINRVDQTIDRNPPNYTKPGGVDLLQHKSDLQFVPADLLEYFPGLSDNDKWRESRFLQMTALYRGGFFNELRTASRKYRQVESIRVIQSRIRQDREEAKILSDLALYFEGQAYFTQIPRPENAEGASVMGLFGVELDPGTLNSKGAEQARTNFIKLAEDYPQSPIVLQEGLNASSFSRTLSAELLSEMESIFTYGGTLAEKTEFAYEWLAGKELAIGRFYLTTKQGPIFNATTPYHSAAMRFNGFLSRFPHSKQKPEALYLLSVAFNGMEDFEQEEQTVALLEDVFPGNEWAVKARMDFNARRGNGVASGAASATVRAKPVRQEREGR